ncbi:Kinesin light chain [Lachnellula suecica]|uniref:Kinesin light chain n=1 Tax=Lachnellula suecica TaxID=602035 RepID=A0A8T9CK68_9HELO|nr:Kinesin light chain [Lachnellula suecica]
MPVEGTIASGTSLGSQLSDAITTFLYRSFEDVAKNLVTRLAATETKSVANVEEKEIISAPSPSSPSEAETEPKPLFNVPHERNPDFVGRSVSFAQLFGIWKPGSKGRIAVVGLGGTGKTEFVVEFVHRIRDVSPKTPVYWFRAVDLISDSGSSPPTTSSAAGMQLEEWLDQSHSPNCILVVDPGDKFSDLLQTNTSAGRLLDRLQSFEGTVIVLTRSVQHGNLLAGPRQVCELHNLDIEASVSLLGDNLGPQAQSSPDEIQEVVQLMTCLPRAILQVAALLNCTGMTIPQFIKLYQTGCSMKLRLFGTLDPVSQPDYIYSIVEKGVIDIRAFRNDFSKAAQILFKSYYLGGNAVPGRILSSFDHLETIITMNILRGHFVMVEERADTYTVHPLAYLAIRRILEGERPQTDKDNIEEEQRWFEEVVVSFSDFYPDTNSEDRDWWRSCLTQLGSYDLNINPLQTSIARIYHKESGYFRRKGSYIDALRMALLAKNTLPDPVPQEHLSILQDQISLLHLLGNYKDVQTALQRFPPDEQQSTMLWKKRMQAKLEQEEGANRYDSAVAVFREVKSLWENTNLSMPDSLQSVDDFGCILMLKGRYAEASSECRKAFSGRNELLGSSHVDTLTSLHHLALIMRLDGKFEEGLRYIQQAIHGREILLGVHHPETLQSKIVKARILFSTAIALSDFDETETLLVDSSNRLSKILSDTHPLVVACRSDRAQIMLARGKYDASEQMNKATLSTREKGPWMEPSCHPETLESVHQLAELIRFKEGCQAADALSERALAERTDVLTNGTLTGSDFHPDQLTSLHHRAIVLSGLGQHLPALQKIDLALTGRRTVLGSDHPDVFLSMTWKGEIMRSQLPTYQTQRSQTLDAIEGLHRQALEGLTWIFGSEHQNTLLCLTNLALAKHERGAAGQKEAETLYRQIYRAYERNLGELHPETLKSKSRLAESMRALSPNNHQEAKKMWRESCAGFSKIFGIEAYLTETAYREYEKFLKMYPEP